MGIGDWGLGIGDWAQYPIPNHQSTIPKIFPLKIQNKNRKINLTKNKKYFHIINKFYKY